MLKKYSIPLLVALLAVLSLAVYWRTTGFSLISLDDAKYTVLDPIVARGLTLSGVKEAFAWLRTYNFLFIPWLSYMADVEIHGLDPSGFHTTNVIIHLLNSLLLFALLFRATGAPVKSFFAAAIWTIHPMRVESVAWVAERSDLVSGFFFFSGLLAYVEYARTSRKALYFATLGAFVLGLASKPIMVVFPAVLLIMDFWPLGRFAPKREAIRKLLVEKLPFIILSLIFSSLTLLNQSNMVFSQDDRSALARLGDSGFSVLHYLKATFWPVNLVMAYRTNAVYLDGFLAAAAWAAVIGLIFAAWRLRKTVPAVTAGWCWFLAVLFPVSGIVPLGFFYVADHYTYLPHAGLFVALVWGGEALWTKFAKPLAPLTAAGGVLIVLLTVLSFRQVSIWRDANSFYGTIDVTTGGRSALAKYGLGMIDFMAGNYHGAYMNLGKAMALAPSFPMIQGLKGDAADKLGRAEEAVFLYREQLRIMPGNRNYSINIVNALIRAGDLAGAARQALMNIEAWPDDGETRLAIRYFGGLERTRVVAGK